MSARNYYNDGQFEVSSPSGKMFTPPKGRYWVVNRDRFQQLNEDRRIWWGDSGDNMPALKRFLSEVKQGMAPQTLWKYEDVGHTQEAKKELLEFVPYENTDNVLDTVKPTRLLQRILQLGTTPSDQDLVIDFFGGSCSTAHAVMNQNRDDGGNRRFIVVQLPEPLPVPESMLKYLTDIGKERIRRVIAKLQKEAEGQLDLRVQETDVATDATGAITGPARPEVRPEDLGFKVFKLAKPHIQLWDGTGPRDQEGYAKKLALYNDPLVPGWKAEGVLWEVALREGYGLNTRFEKKSLDNGTIVYVVSDPDTGQRFTVCLDDEVRADVSRHLELKADDVFICRDKALDDTAAANLALQCRLKTI